MSSTRQPPMGTPQLATHAGLTPQMSIVDANGRPTMFFFRWLLTIGSSALTADDSSILESFDPGADAAIADSAIADALDAAGTAAGFDDSGAARGELLARLEELALAGALRSGAAGAGPTADQRALEALAGASAVDEAVTSDQRALEAFLMADAPAAQVTPITFLADTLANWTLANYNPANYAAGQQFLVTTWQVIYAVEAGLWTYTSGTYIAPAASRPLTAFNGAALGALDIGLQFLASDTHVLQYWNGSAWVAIASPAAPPFPQHQTNVTASRAIGTVYQNTLSTPIFVIAGIANNPLTGSVLSMHADTTNPPGAQISTISFSAALNDTNYASLATWVLPGNYYQVVQNSGASVLITWFEWS